jgi:hypothetical protein
MPEINIPDSVSSALGTPSTPAPAPAATPDTTAAPTPAPDTSISPGPVPFPATPAPPSSPATLPLTQQPKPQQAVALPAAAAAPPMTPKQRVQMGLRHVLSGMLENLEGPSTRPTFGEHGEQFDDQGNRLPAQKVPTSQRVMQGVGNVVGSMGQGLAAGRGPGGGARSFAASFGKEQELQQHEKDARNELISQNMNLYRSYRQQEADDTAAHTKRGFRRSRIVGRKSDCCTGSGSRSNTGSGSHSNTGSRSLGTGLTQTSYERP